MGLLRLHKIGEVWYGRRPRPRPHCVIWRPSPPKKRAQKPPPHLAAHVYCGQTVRWIKMPLGKQVGLDTGDSIRWGHPTLPRKGAQQLPHPTFSACIYYDQTVVNLSN